MSVELQAIGIEESNDIVERNRVALDRLAWIQSDGEGSIRR